MKKTSCQRGHDLTVPENVITRKDGMRQCRPCNLAAKKALYAARAAHRLENDPTYRPNVPPEVTTCAVEGCDRPRQYTNGPSGGRLRWCAGHQARRAKYGDLFEELPIGRGGMPRSLPARRAQGASSGAASDG